MDDHNVRPRHAPAASEWSSLRIVFVMADALCSSPKHPLVSAHREGFRVEGALAGSVEGFFVSGGTVPLESPSYVARGADAALFEALSAGRFCYVLNSRQMGKSSLCVRTMARLQAAGARTAFVDLTKIGGRNVTPDQWYAGLVVEVGRALGLRTEMLRNWQEEQALSPMQRFFSALRDVALEKVDSQIVIFVDEIDATRSLSFSANEFFAGIRECYNRRVRGTTCSSIATSRSASNGPRRSKHASGPRTPSSRCCLMRRSAARCWNTSWKRPPVTS